MEICTANMSREEWLSERRKYIGGSDAAAIMGMNPYKTPLSVYSDKLGLSPDQEDSELMRQGRDLEEYVAQRFAESTEFQVKKVDSMFVSADYPFMAANVDRMLVFQPVGLECKTTSIMNKTDFAYGEVPPTFYWQCVHYMAVTGFDCWYLAVLVLSKSFHVFKIDRNEEHINLLIDAEVNFWNNHVLKQIPPYPTGAESDDDAVKSIYPMATNDEATDISEFESDLYYLQLLKRDADMLKAKISEIEQRVKLGIGEYSSGFSRHFDVSYKNQTRRTVDVDKLKAEKPDIYEQYTKASISRVLRVKEIKE